MFGLLPAFSSMAGKSIHFVADPTDPGNSHVDIFRTVVSFTILFKISIHTWGVLCVHYQSKSSVASVAPSALECVWGIVGNSDCITTYASCEFGSILNFPLTSALPAVLLTAGVG